MKIHLHRRTLLVQMLAVCVLGIPSCGAPAAAPSPTAAPPTVPATSAPQPTVAPTATVAPTIAPTPTSAPGVISSGDQLGLAAEFVPISKDDLAQKIPPELAPAAGISEPSKQSSISQTCPGCVIHWFQFPVKASFAFVNADATKFVYGYTEDLSGPKDQSTFDTFFVDNFFANMRLNVLQYTQDAKKIKDLSVGDKSSGVTARPAPHGVAWQLNVVSFRVGSTGAFVFTLYPGAADPPIDIVKLAQAYAATLK